MNIPCNPSSASRLDSLSVNSTISKRILYISSELQEPFVHCSIKGFVANNHAYINKALFFRLVAQPCIKEIVTTTAMRLNSMVFLLRPNFDFTVLIPAFLVEKLLSAI
jgi:hypothetical protein